MMTPLKSCVALLLALNFINVLLINAIKINFEDGVSSDKVSLFAYAYNNPMIFNTVSSKLTFPNKFDVKDAVQWRFHFLNNVSNTGQNTLTSSELKKVLSKKTNEEEMFYLEHVPTGKILGLQDKQVSSTNEKYYNLGLETISKVRAKKNYDDYVFKIDWIVTISDYTDNNMTTISNHGNKCFFEYGNTREEVGQKKGDGFVRCVEHNPLAKTYTYSSVIPEEIILVDLNKSKAEYAVCNYKKRYFYWNVYEIDQLIITPEIKQFLRASHNNVESLYITNMETRLVLGMPYSEENNPRSFSGDITSIMMKNITWKFIPYVDKKRPNDEYFFMLNVDRNEYMHSANYKDIIPFRKGGSRHYKVTSSSINNLNNKYKEVLLNDLLWKKIMHGCRFCFSLINRRAGKMLHAPLVDTSSVVLSNPGLWMYNDYMSVDIWGNQLLKCWKPHLVEDTKKMDKILKDSPVEKEDHFFILTSNLAKVVSDTKIESGNGVIIDTFKNEKTQHWAIVNSSYDSYKLIVNTGTGKSLCIEPLKIDTKKQGINIVTHPLVLFSPNYCLWKLIKNQYSESYEIQNKKQDWKNGFYRRGGVQNVSKLAWEGGNYMSVESSNIGTRWSIINTKYTREGKAHKKCPGLKLEHLNQEVKKLIFELRKLRELKYELPSFSEKELQQYSFVDDECFDNFGLVYLDPSFVEVIGDFEQGGVTNGLIVHPENGEKQKVLIKKSNTIEECKREIGYLERFSSRNTVNILGFTVKDDTCFIVLQHGDIFVNQNENRQLRRSIVLQMYKGLQDTHSKNICYNSSLDIVLHSDTSFIVSNSLSGPVICNELSHNNDMTIAKAKMESLLDRKDVEKITNTNAKKITANQLQEAFNDVDSEETANETSKKNIAIISSCVVVGILLFAVILGVCGYRKYKTRDLLQGMTPTEFILGGENVGEEKDNLEYQNSINTKSDQCIEMKEI